MRFNTQPPEGGWRAYSVLLDCLALFQHTAARRRLARNHRRQIQLGSFQHTAARRRLEKSKITISHFPKFQHTAARRRLDSNGRCHKRRRHRFNTQPPEGGWQTFGHNRRRQRSFNTQPPEGGWHVPPAQKHLRL